MPCNRCRNDARRRGRRRGDACENTTSNQTCSPSENDEMENVITDRFYCCNAPESIAQEFYAGPDTDILMKTCYDANGRTYHDARTRCTFWPSFARPRWLTCAELYNKEMD